MAIALVVGILYLITELLAHTLVFGGSCKTAGAIAARALESLLYRANDLLVVVKLYLHISHRTPILA